MGEAVKVCRKCKVEQSIDNFLIPKSTNKPTARCNTCRKESQREQYKRSRPHIKTWIYDYLSSNPCVDCGESDPMRLEFDHRGEKHFDIGKSFIGKAKNLDIVQSEIAKCDVRCANCHKVKTHKEQDTWKYRMSVERSQ
jgi:hypothetical protein